MSLFTFESSGTAPKRGNKSLKLVLGIGALAGAITLGSTLAANINLNGGGNVEFGQGLVTATSCDPDITLTPFSTFFNSQGGGSFMGTSIVISDVDSSIGGCAGKIFTITGYGDTSPTPIAQIIVAVASTSPWFTIEDILGATLDDVSSSSFTITIDPAIIPIEVTEVSRFTVESKDSVDTAPVGYEVGDIGPGGGKIFYVDANGFNCGPLFNETGSPTQGKCNYLEAAPNTWNGNSGDPAVDFCNVYSEIMTIDDLGAGFSNSISMLSACSSGAANLVETYNLSNGGGKSDWFLGSRNEMAQLHAAKDVVGGWQVGDDVAYWMSANHTGDRALVFRIFPGSGFDGLIEDKLAPRYVRPIRAF